MDDDFREEIRGLLDSGQKIAAIKRYREQTGAGLAEAKAAVEALESVESLPDSVQSDNSDFTAQIVNLLERREKIQAIKLHREETGLGLKEAKDAVEAYMGENAN